MLLKLEQDILDFISNNEWDIFIQDIIKHLLYIKPEEDTLISQPSCYSVKENLQTCPSN